MKTESSRSKKEVELFAAAGLKSRTGCPDLEAQDWKSRTGGQRLEVQDHEVQDWRSRSGGPGLEVNYWKSRTAVPGLEVQDEKVPDSTQGLGLDDRVIKITQSVDPPTGLMNEIMPVWGRHCCWEGAPMWLLNSHISFSPMCF